MVRENRTKTLDDGSFALYLERRYSPGEWTVVDAEDYPRVRQHRWHVTEKGYAATNTPGGETTKVTLHRFIMRAAPGEEIDHKDRDPLNNRRSNLRQSNDSLNAANRAPIGTFKGVRITESGRYLARAGVTKNGVSRTYMLGTYRTPEEAARAYDAFAREHWGSHARLNFPDDEA